MHQGKELWESASDEFIGYVAITGEHVIESSNIEKSNYFDPEYEK